MGKRISTKKFAANILISIVAQIISLAVGFIIGLVVPRFIDEFSYAYWQTYLLYVGYVGVLHFGLLDGIVLRYGAYDFNELDRFKLRSQFKILLIITSAFAALLIAVSLTVFDQTNKLIFAFVAISIILKNVSTYNTYILQITNRINNYVVTTLSQRVTYGLVIVLLLVCRVQDFYWFCLADIFGDCIAIIFGVSFNRGRFYLGSSVQLSGALSELKLNISSGIILMLSNWSSILLMGGARMFIEWRWDELVFGKVSFAFSLTNLFLTFVTAVSVVLFPSLKRIDESELPKMYKNIRELISPILFFAMLFYFPGCWIIERWLPAYSVSLEYLAILLPIIVYSSKVTLLTNNYLKVYRKEKSMLLVNAVSVAVGIILFSVCAYLINNLIALLISAVIVVFFNSVLSEIVVMRIINVRIVKDFIFEAVLVIGFIVMARMLELWIGFIGYFALFALYCILKYKTLIQLFKSVVRKFRKSPEEVPDEQSQPSAAGDNSADN